MAVRKKKLRERGRGYPQVYIKKHVATFRCDLAIINLKYYTLQDKDITRYDCPTQLGQ